MTVIILPNLNKWSSARWGMATGDTVLETMNGNEQIIKGPPPKRFYQISLSTLSGEDRTLWQLALEQLTSFGNTFIAPPPDFSGPLSGYAGANPLVNGSSQLGSSVIADGATVSTLIVKAGDPITINGELKRATANATSDVSGNVTIPFYPPFRTSPPDNTEIFIDAPTVVLRLIQSNYSMDFDAMINGAASINAIETWS